jgi:hypothetical protein
VRVLSRQFGYPSSFRGQVRGTQCSLPCFPSMGLVTRRPPSLRRVPARPVPRLPRYYEAATTSRRACPSAYGFALGSPHDLGSSCSPQRSRRTPSSPSGQEPCYAGAPGPAVYVRARAGPLRFPGDPSLASAVLRDPGRTGRPRHSRTFRCCPRAQQTEGFDRTMISRLTHGFSDRCLRFASTVADARARLASGWRAAPLPGGGRTRWVTMKGFRLHPSPFPGLTLTLVGPTAGGSCSTSTPRPARRSPRRRWSGSPRCSRSRPRSTVTAPEDVGPSGRSGRCRGSRS